MLNSWISMLIISTQQVLLLDYYYWHPIQSQAAKQTLLLPTNTVCQLMQSDFRQRLLGISIMVGIFQTTAWQKAFLLHRHPWHKVGTNGATEHRWRSLKGSIHFSCGGMQLAKHAQQHAVPLTDDMGYIHYH